MTTYRRQDEFILEDAENANNWNKAIEVPASRRKRFLASKIHKLKKILKLSSKRFAAATAKGLSLEEMQNQQNELEFRQNRENEELERKFAQMTDSSTYQQQQQQQQQQYESDQNVENENWENWDSCYYCATGQPNCCYQWSTTSRRPENSPSSNSICYVFMPGEREPVPVKLRTTRIPGGVMWISYRPDLDICAARDNEFSSSAFLTSSQMAQGQRPVFV